MVHILAECVIIVTDVLISIEVVRCLCTWYSIEHYCCLQYM